MKNSNVVGKSFTIYQDENHKTMVEANGHHYSGSFVKKEGNRNVKYLIFICGDCKEVSTTKASSYARRKDENKCTFCVNKRDKHERAIKARYSFLPHEQIIRTYKNGDTRKREDLSKVDIICGEKGCNTVVAKGVDRRDVHNHLECPVCGYNLEVARMSQNEKVIWNELISWIETNGEEYGMTLDNIAFNVKEPFVKTATNGRNFMLDFVISMPENYAIRRFTIEHSGIQHAAKPTNNLYKLANQAKLNKGSKMVSLYKRDEMVNLAHAMYDIPIFVIRDWNNKKVKKHHKGLSFESVLRGKVNDIMNAMIANVYASGNAGQKYTKQINTRKFKFLRKEDVIVSIKYNQNVN